MRIDPAVVTSLVPHDLNIILERQDLAPEDRFDLIVATNILLYYGIFEQSLALSNLASMLRPHGLFLSNDYVAPLPDIPMTIVGDTEVSYTGTGTDDIVSCPSVDVCPDTSTGDQRQYRKYERDRSQRTETVSPHSDPPTGLVISVAAPEIPRS